MKRRFFQSLCFVLGILLGGGFYLGCSSVEQDTNGSTTATAPTTQQSDHLVSATLVPLPDQSGLIDTPAAVEVDAPDPVAAPQNVPTDVEAEWLMQTIAAFSAEPAE